jgi:hypothetical protein
MTVLRRDWTPALPHRRAAGAPRWRLSHRAEEDQELAEIEDDIHQLLSTYLISEAERHFVPIPKFEFSSGKWERSRVSDRDRLTENGIRELRSAIRAERKEGSELARSWLTGLTGLIGVLIGLLAIILGRR